LSPAAPPLGGYLPGDADRDKGIDNRDLQLILGAGKFGRGPTYATWEEGDLDGDRDSHNADLQLILATARFGTGRIRVHADFVDEPHRTFDLADIAQVIAYLCAGNDHLAISSSVSLPTIAHGGSRSDLISASGNLAVLLGNDGADTLIGRTGRNVLIGGDETGRLVGGRGQDVLIGGSTDIDADDIALMELLQEWGKTGEAYAARVAAINAMYSVNDDGVRDRLTGSADLDLFYDGIDDVLNDLKPAETVV